MGFRHRQIGNDPVIYGIHAMAVKAGSDAKLGATMWAGSLGMKGIKRLAALAALPEVSERGRRMANRARVSHAARYLCQFRQRARMLQSSPAVHQDEGGEYAEPERPHPNRQGNQPDHTGKADHGGDHQAAGASQQKPKQRPQNLPAVEGVDRQHIKNQEAEIDVPHRSQQRMSIGVSGGPSQVPAQVAEAAEYWNEHNIN
jgi:hypothetical protein